MVLSAGREEAMLANSSTIKHQHDLLGVIFLAVDGEILHITKTIKKKLIIIHSNNNSYFTLLLEDPIFKLQLYG